MNFTDHGLSSEPRLPMAYIISRHESCVIPPSIYHKVSFVPLIGIVWVIGTQHNLLASVPSRNLSQPKGTPEFVGSKPVSLSFWTVLVVTVVRVLPWRPTDFC